MKQIIIDCQILQTSAYDRGMGKYTLSLLRELIKLETKNVKIELLLNRNLSQENVEEFRALLSSVDVNFLNLPTDLGIDCKSKSQTASKEITQFIASKFKSSDDVTFLQMAPFFVDFPSVFPAQDWVKKTSIVYDFIPLKIWKKLQIFPDDIYLTHIITLLTADVLFTISQAVKEDMIRMFGFIQDRIVNIDGAAFERTDITKTYGMEYSPYFLMPSAPIVHKNNEMAVRGFSLFNQGQDHKYKLLISSSFDADTKKNLTEICKDIVFIGNVSDADLGGAYNNCEGLIFPSLAEGLGMPILEAVEYGKPVACSDIPVFSEMSQSAFYLFEPTDKFSVAESLEDISSGKGWIEKQAAYHTIREKYSWHNSASRLMATIAENSTRPRLNQRVILNGPAPENASPAGTCMELAAGCFLQHGNHVGVNINRSNKKQRYTSFVRYLPAISNPDIEVSFKDRRAGLVGLYGERQVLVTLKNGSQKKTMALNTTKDKTEQYLGLHTWSFRIAGNGSSADTIQLLCKSLQEGI